MPDPKQPPYDLESEQSVIGGVCIRNAALDEISLLPDDFYRVDHQLIWAAILGMHADRIPIDFVTLATRMREHGNLDEVGGLAYLGTITADCPSAANTTAYADVVRDRAVLRRLIAAGQDIASIGFRPDGMASGECVELAEQRIFSLRASIKSKSDGSSYSAVMDRVKAQMERNSQAKGGVIGLSTGLVDLDSKTGGLQDTDLVIVAGRPSMGKSTLAQNIADHVAIEIGKRTAYFSMEMSGEQIGFRALANQTGIPMNILRSGALNGEQWDAVTEAEKRLRRAPMIIDESESLSPMELRGKARKYSQQANLGLIVVDYIQLMHIPGSKENRTNVMSEISRSLKAMAKELRIPVVALSQLNRGVELRDNKRPRMADLRESGGIEQDADMVMMVYRDEVYHERSPDKGTAEILIEKQRNGALGMVRAHFRGELLRFSNLAHGWQPTNSEAVDSGVRPARGYIGRAHQ